MRGGFALALDTNQNKVVVGDITVNLKTELVRSRYFGLALRPFLTIPTGYGYEFFGKKAFLVLALP